MSSPYNISELYFRYPELQVVKDSISKAFFILRDCIREKGKILICGNGGSAADSEHMAGEFVKSFMIRRGLKKDFQDKLAEMYGRTESDKIALSLHEGIKAFSLPSQISFLTAFSNDCDFRMAFAQQVYVLGEEKDVLVAFSTSGNSENVLMALKVAGAIGMKRIFLTGEGGGLGASFAESVINVPATETYKVQEYHLPVYHALCAMIEEEFHGRK